MKRFLLFFISVFIYTISYGQNICAGKIIGRGDPEEPYSAVFGLKTYLDRYILTINSERISYNDEGLIIGDTKYFRDDEVVITGTTSIRENPNWTEYYKEYLELEIETIEKLSPERNIQQFSGTYEIQMDCIEPYGLENCTTLDIEIIPRNSTDPLNIMADFYRQFMYMGSFYATVLNDNSFSFDDWLSQHGYDGKRSNHYVVKGHLKNDSIFIHKKTYRRASDDIIELVEDCHCKGKKIASSGIAPPSVSDKNKVYYDATKQVIVIDETLQNQSLTFELIDMQGKMVCRKTNAGNSLIGVANLPNGIYLYRLLQNGQAIHSGKIMLK